MTSREFEQMFIEGALAGASDVDPQIGIVSVTFYDVDRLVGATITHGYKRHGQKHLALQGVVYDARVWGYAGHEQEAWQYGYREGKRAVGDATRRDVETSRRQVATPVVRALARRAISFRPL